MEKTVIIQNETGIHARPASMLVEEASNYDSDVELVKDEQAVNAKSIMGIMGLGIKQSTEIIVKAIGPDEEEAVQSIVELIESGFGE
jgi:phosphotransferase system HPr (HPr) family protein